MATPFITIIGLGTTGQSLGLALRKEPGSFEVVGHDKAQNAEVEARKSGAVHRTEWNLHKAVEGASLVVLAMPLPAIEETLGMIVEDLAPETLVLPINSLMQPVAEAAARALPHSARIVVGHPVYATRGVGLTASADLLSGITFCLAALPQTDPAAIELASDLVERTGAKPHFTDIAEHDGIMSLVEQLPQMSAAAIMSLSSGSSGWRESRQLAGRRFALATDLGQSAEQITRALLTNRANVALRLEQLQRELARWQTLLDAEPAEGEAHPLLAAVQAIVDERLTWEGQSASQNWDAAPSSMAGSENGTGLFRQLFLGNLGRKKTPPAGSSGTGGSPQ